MFSSTQVATAVRRMPPSTSLPSPEPGSSPVAWFGPIEDEDHILVLGGQGPELMCALLHAGATNVTHLRAHERPEADSASLVIVPRVPSLDWLATALPSIRRALTAHGRLVLLAGSQPTMQIQIRRMLTLHGLSAIRVQTTRDGQVVSAERPIRQFA
jgi:hypothetical protein